MPEASLSSSALNAYPLPDTFSDVFVAPCDRTLVLVSSDGLACAFLDEHGVLQIRTIPPSRVLDIQGAPVELPDPTRFPGRLLSGMDFEVHGQACGLWSSSDPRASELRTEFWAAVAAGKPRSMLIPPPDMSFVFFEDVEVSERSPRDIIALRATRELLDSGERYSPLVRQRVPQLLPSALTATPVIRDCLQHVILPVTRGLPAEVSVEVDTAAHPSIRLVSRGTYQGTPYELAYRVLLRQQAGVTTAPLSLRAENQLTLPVSGWDPATLAEMQCALRRMFIADPQLNPRFRSSVVTLEPYQRAMARAAIEEIRRSGSVLVVSATGSGKTVVAAVVIDESLRMLDSALTGSPGRALFVVSNVTILSDVERRLREMFGERYPTSRVYGGKEDLSGRVVFATPASLLGSSRLQRVLSTGSVRLFVVDETHHLPAETYLAVDRAIQAQAALSGTLTARLGMTATPVRMDGASVPALFGDHIAFEYPVTRGWEEGYLAPMRYIAGDLDMNPQNLPMVGPNSALREVYRQRRYAEERFPYIVALYKRETADLTVRRGLFVCPNVERAGRMAAYLCSQGVHSVTLTNEDRQRPDDWFGQHYAAWKYGSWPAESPFSAEPVPEVVCAVDIFSEGADVPGLTCIVIWDDSDSVTRVPQIRGRGDRPAPLKAECRFIDAAGVFRKLHILNLLVGGESRTARREREPVDTDPDAPLAALDDALELPVGVTLDHDVSKLVLSFLEDVAQLLATRYSTYHAVPASEHGRLDRFLAKRLSYSTLAAFDAGIRELGEALVQTRGTQGANVEGVRALRERVLPAFYSVGIFSEDSSGPIPVTAPTLIVYLRLLHKLRALCPECTLEDVHGLLPEFNPARDQLLGTRAANIRALRVHVLGGTTYQAMQELCSSLLVGNRVVEGSPVHTFLEHHLNQRRAGNQVDLWQLMEGRVETRHEFELGNGTFVRDRLLPADREYLVTMAVEALLAHPRLAPHLTRDDFTLERDAFRQKLVECGLAQPSRATVTDFCTLVQARASDLLRAHSKQGAPEQRVAREALLALLRDGSSRTMIEGLSPTASNLELVRRAVATVQEVRAALLKNGKPVDREVEGALAELLALGGVWFTVALPELRNAELALTRYGPESYMLALHPGHAAQLGAPSRPMLVALEQDYFGNPHLILEASDEAQPLEQRYAEYAPAARDALLRGVMSVMHECRASFDEPPVVTIPQGADGFQFFPDLQQYLLTHTDWDVLGPVTRTQLSTRARRIEHTMETLGLSRLERIATPAYLQALRHRHQPSNSVVGGLGEIYLRWQEYRDEIAPVLAGYEAALADSELDEQSKTIADKIRSLYSPGTRARVYRGAWSTLHGLATHLRPVAEGYPVTAGILAEAFLGALCAVNRFLADEVGLTVRGLRVVRSSGASFTVEQENAEALLIDIALSQSLSLEARKISPELYGRLLAVWNALKGQVPRIERSTLRELRLRSGLPLSFSDTGFLQLWLKADDLAMASGAPASTRPQVVVHAHPDCSELARDSTGRPAERYTTPELDVARHQVAFQHCKHCNSPPARSWRDCELGRWQQLRRWP